MLIMIKVILYTHHCFDFHQGGSVSLLWLNILNLGKNEAAEKKQPLMIIQSPWFSYSEISGSKHPSDHVFGSRTSLSVRLEPEHVIVAPLISELVRPTHQKSDSGNSNDSTLAWDTDGSYWLISMFCIHLCICVFVYADIHVRGLCVCPWLWVERMECVRCDRLHTTFPDSSGVGMKTQRFTVVSEEDPTFWLAKHIPQTSQDQKKTCNCITTRRIVRLTTIHFSYGGNLHRVCLVVPSFGSMQR